MDTNTKILLGVFALVLSADVLAVSSRVELNSTTPTTSISSEQIQSLPARQLDISLLAPRTGAVSVQGVTGQDGRLPVQVRGLGEWRPVSTLIDGRLILPDNAFGVIRDARMPSLSELESVEILRQPFGVMYGQVVDPVKFVTRSVDPFMLLCRGDEGMPTLLGTGDRYVAEVPFKGLGGAWQTNRNDLSLDLRADYGAGGFDRDAAWQYLRSGNFGSLYGGDRSSWQPEIFPLPAWSGFNLGLDAGAKPLDTSDALADLRLSGSIKAFELDPCWQYYPDAPAQAGGMGCVAGEPAFEQKAVRYGEDIQARLSDAYTGKPIADAWVLYGPLSPTPFFDPGEQPGDELPPTFTRTDLDGGYRIPLNGLTGPFEVRVAQGCGSHTTVAIADPAGGAPGAGATHTAGGGTSSGATTTSTPTRGGSTPPSAPDEKPPEGARVCGPDITDHVLGTLQFMVETFNQWDEATKDAKCSSLYGLQADGAWEMRHMGPFDSDRGKDPYLYFGRYFQDRCAVPRWPCGATVQFLGVCMDAQIVNYVAWGAMNHLCDNQDIAILAHMARDRVVNIFRGLKDAIVNKSPSRLRIGKGPVYDAQDAMSHIGEAFAERSDGLAARKRYLEALMQVKVESYPDISKTEGFDCALDCGNSASDLGKLDNYDWGFNWGLEWYDRGGSALSKP
jgi:hypothetical protein